MSIVGVVLLRWAFLASALAMASALVPDVSVSGGFWGLAGASALFGLVNVLLAPLIRRLAIPLNAVTFGLLSLVVNGLLLALTAGLSDALEVGGFVQTLVAAFVITLIAAAVQLMLYGAAEGTSDQPSTTPSPEPRTSQHRRDPS